MNISNIILLATLVFYGSSFASANSLSGIAKQYDEQQKSGNYKNVSHEVNSKLPSVFYSGNYEILFEDTTINDIKNHFGGKIKKDNSKTWVCYNSKHEGITYWFISYTELAHGDLTTIILSLLDKKANCNTTTHAINLKYNVLIPKLGSYKSQILNRFNLKTNNNVDNITIYKLTPDNEGYIKDNYVQYFFRNNKAIGIFMSQITTN